MFEFADDKATLAISELVAAYGSYLQQRGYEVGSMTAYVHAVEHFTRWLAGQGIKLCESEKAVARFLAGHLPGCSCPGPVQRHKETMRSACPPASLHAGGWADPGLGISLSVRDRQRAHDFHEPPSTCLRLGR